MRIAAVFVAAALAAAPAAAQLASLPPADNRAEVSGKMAEVIAASGARGFNTRVEMRELTTAALADGRIANDELDLMREMLGFKPVAVTAAGQTVSIPPPPSDIAWMLQSLVTPPNLHQLWHQGGPAADQLLELARLGPAMHQRIYRFIGNQLDDAWKKSTFISAYGEYVGALNGQYKAFETLPADVEMRTFAFDLLSTGVAYGIEKAKAENREPPKDFLYTWLLLDDTKPRFVSGQPRDLPQQLQPQASQQYQ